MANFILPPEYSKLDDDGNEISGGREKKDSQRVRAQEDG
jgi:hypothetical protein